MTMQDREHKHDKREANNDESPLPSPDEILAEPGPTDKPALKQAAGKPFTWVFLITITIAGVIGLLAAYFFFMM